MAAKSTEMKNTSLNDWKVCAEIHTPVCFLEKYDKQLLAATDGCLYNSSVHKVKSVLDLVDSVSGGIAYFSFSHSSHRNDFMNALISWKIPFDGSSTDLDSLDTQEFKSRDGYLQFVKDEIDINDVRAVLEKYKNPADAVKRLNELMDSLQGSYKPLRDYVDSLESQNKKILKAKKSADNAR